MDKKILAFLASTAAVAMFSACGSQDVPDDPVPQGPDYSDYEDIERNGDIDTVSVNRAIAFQQQGAKFRGTLNNNINGNPPLDYDYYKIELSTGDPVSITVVNRSSGNTQLPLRVQFYIGNDDCPRPEKNCMVKKDVKVLNQAQTVIEEVISSGHFEADDKQDAKKPFYIVISSATDQVSFADPYSYAIKIKLGN